MQGLVNARAARHLVQEGLPAEAAFEQDPGGRRVGTSTENQEGDCRQKEQGCQGPEAEWCRCAQGWLEVGGAGAAEKGLTGDYEALGPPQGHSPYWASET